MNSSRVDLDTQISKILSKSLPKNRGLYSEMVQVILILSFLIGYTLFEPSENSIMLCITYYSMYIFAFGIAEFLKRFSYIFEECRHLCSRYNNNRGRLFYNIFHVSPFILLIFIMIGIFLFNICELHDHNFTLYDFLIIISSYMTINLLNISKSPLNMSHNIDQINGLDYGSGMAHSFFTGYLNIVLPHTGTEARGLKELMKDYESKHNITFSVYKLFILIPSSLKCPPSLDQISNIIETSGSLDSKMLDRAGVKGRVYKNSVYKLKMKDKKMYVSAEYATPLRTLQDVIYTSHRHGRIYKQYKNDILLAFYNTLKELIETSEDCADVCDLIYYDDVSNNIDVGKLLLHRIYQLKKKMKEKNS